MTKIKITPKPVVMRSCPFCGGEAELNSEYESDENSPDGYNHFVSCKECEARGQFFYAVHINDTNIRFARVKEQNEQIEPAASSAVEAWNKRHDA